MKPLLLLILTFFLSLPVFSQLTVPPDGGNKKSMVGERIGLTDVTIRYDAPGVKGREGKIWGVLVPYGFTDLGFGTSKAAPWRAGANENTTMDFSTDVKIAGQDLPAGRYGFFIAVYPDHCTLIFSKNATSWGSFFYDSTEDVLRVNVVQEVQDKSTEWLKYGFEKETPNSAVVALLWEKWKIPFTVSVDLNKTQIESFRRELRSSKGFTWTAWNQAARYCLDHDYDLEEGLQWSDYAVNGRFIGVKNFETLSTRAGILQKLGKDSLAEDLLQQAIPLADMNELHAYAKTLLQQHKTDQAVQLFKLNYEKHPNTFVTNVGMMRANSATGNYTEALKFAQLALAQAPDPANKASIESALVTLQAGKDINQ